MTQGRTGDEDRMVEQVKRLGARRLAEIVVNRRSAFQGFTMARGRVARGPGAPSSPQTGDRGFESTFLQRRVCKPSVPLDVGGLRGGFFARATSPGSRKRR